MTWNVRISKACKNTFIIITVFSLLSLSYIVPGFQSRNYLMVVESLKYIKYYRIPGLFDHFYITNK